MKFLRHLVLFVTLALVTTACIKVDMTIDVADDGSAEVSGIVAMNAKVISDMAADFGDEEMSDRDSICNDFVSEQDSDVDGLESKPYNDGDFCGVEFTGSLSPDQVEQEMGALAGSDEILVEERNGGWYFEMVLSDESLGTGDLEGAEAFFDIDELFGEAEYIIRVRLPGKQVDHNGVIDSDGAVVWDINPLAPPERLFLQTEPGERETGAGIGGDDEGSNTTVIIIVVLALLALAVAAYFLLRKKGDDDADPSPDAEPAFATAAAAPAPPQQDFAQPAPDPQPAAQDFAPPPAPEPEPEPVVEPTQEQPAAAPTGSPSKEEATGAPAWDPVRGQYVQWDPTAQHWLVHDQESGEWKAE